MKKYFIIDMIPKEGMYATTLKGDICTTSIPELATRFNSIKEAKEYIKENLERIGYGNAKIKTLNIQI